MAFIKIEVGAQPGRIIDLDEVSALTFGRSGDNIVFIDSAKASRRHAEVRYEGEGYVLYDLKSKNGIKVNGDSVDEYPLDHNDSFEIAGQVFRFLTELPETKSHSDWMEQTVDEVSVAELHNPEPKKSSRVKVIRPEDL